MKKKLGLQPDTLRVDSFETREAEGARGTVEGASLPTLPLCTRYGCVSSECPTVPCTYEIYTCPQES